LIDLKEARTRREEFFARGVKRFFFSNLNRRFFKKSEKKEGGEGEKEREKEWWWWWWWWGERLNRTHTERKRENERGDVRLFYDKNSLD